MIGTQKKSNIKYKKKNITSKNYVKSILKLEIAQKIIKNILKKARKLNYKPLSIVIIDTGGNLVSMVREDGAGHFRSKIAIAKATTAIGMGEPTSYFEKDEIKKNQNFLKSLNHISKDKFMPVAGGVLIKKKNKIIGAVGISGDSSKNDETIGIYGIKSVGLN